MIPESTTFACHVLGGKKTLLKELPTRLRGYTSWLPPNWRIMVLVDRDEEDCRRLKDRLEKLCQTAGLIPKTAAGDKQPAQVINRIVVEELDA